MVHDDPSDPDESGSPAVLSAASLITLTATITDGDLDTDEDTADIGDAFKFEDDGPSIMPSGMAAPTLTTDDTEIGMPATDTQNFAGLFAAADFGEDGLKDTDDNDDMPDDDALSYSLSVVINGDDSLLVDTLTGDRILLRVNGSGDVEGYLENSITTVAFLISVDTAGMVTLTQNRSIVHDDPTDPDETGADAETLAANIQVTLTATVIDGDLDPASTEREIGLAFHFEDDGPTIDITGGTGMGIPGLANGAPGEDGDLFVEFLAGDSDSALLNEVGGEDGVKSIAITDYSGDGDGLNGAAPVVNGVTLEVDLVNNDTLVNYFIDGDSMGNVAGVFDGNGTLFYTYELKDLKDALGMPGTDGILDTAVFTVHDVPPASSPDFNLNDLASGQNAFGLLASHADSNPLTPIDPDGPAIVFFGRNSEYNSPMDGTKTNTSDTINTSKGGGPTTIGVSNQMVDGITNNDDDGEGIFLHYLSDAVDDFISGLDDDPATLLVDEGLDSGEAKDFNNMQYAATLHTEGAFFSISQVQSQRVVEARITAYDSPIDDAQGTLLVDALQGLVAGDAVTITEITITNLLNGTEETFLRSAGDVMEGDVMALPGLSIDWIDGADTNGDIGSVVITGLLAKDTISFVTDDPHDTTLIEGFSGKFDIGDFGLDLENPTPDQLLQFEVTITDGDDDIAIDDHFVGIDGTFEFDDNMIDVLLV